MTDVYIAYAREDRDRLRPLADMLRYEGWDVWMDQAESLPDGSPIPDAKLNAAGAIVAVWSERSRRSEVVRSEAASGLYKNKLIQVRIDAGAPPRPFDQVEVVDLSQWRGSYDDAHLRKLILALRRSVGEPTAAKPVQPQPKKKVAQAEPPPPPISSFSSPPQAQAYRAPEPEYRPLPPQVAPPAPRPAMTLSSPPPETSYRAAAAEPDYRPAPPPAAPPSAQPEMTLSSPVQGTGYRTAAAMAPEYHTPPAPPPETAYRPLPPEPPVYRPPETGYRMAESTYRVPEPPPYRPPPPEPAYRPPERSYRPLAEPMPDIADTPQRLSSTVSYREPRRGATWGPIAAAGLLIASGVGLWFGDPFGWRASGPEEAEPVAMAVRRVPEVKVANGEPATPVFEDSEESSKNWTRVNRKNPEALRDFVAEYPRTSQAEAARSALRVLDAQAWVTAVTSDSESAYQGYLKRFPAEGPSPGIMVAVAQERLTALGVERQQAIEEIQRGLAAIDLYDGATDGRGGDATTKAMKAFASSAKRSAPSLTAASPRELRSFAQAVRGAGSQPVTSAAVAAANEADKKRLAQAQAASLAASEAAEADEGPNADALALTQQQRIVEATAWEQADKAGTLVAYRNYLEAWPNGTQVAAARAAVVKLERPAAYSLDQLTPELRSAVEAARAAQSTAAMRAGAARRAATEAADLADARSIQSPNGDRYDAQIANGAPNGLGIRTRGAGVNAGDRYRGDLRNGQAVGVGVYEFAENPANVSGRALRYEGEHANDAISGFGVFYWRGGDTFSGSGAGGSGSARGVLTYANGQRYEGEMLNGLRNGLGVVWGADGAVIQAGRWSKDQLDGPVKLP